MSLADQTVLKNRIKEVTGLHVTALYDGFEPSEKDKPFITIELLNNAGASSTKLRDSFATSQLYQIGIYPTSNREQKELSEVIIDSLIFYDFIDFTVDDNISVQPIPPETASDTLNYHRAFISVTIHKRKHRN